MTKVKIDSSSVLQGNMDLGDKVYIAQGASIVSIEDSVSIANESWILENSVIIGSPNHSLSIGSKTVLGHKTTIIGASIGNLCEIGNNTIIMPGAQVGDFCIFGEGSLVKEGMQIPDNSVVIGKPARIIRSLSKEDKKMIERMRNNDIKLSPIKFNTMFFEKEERNMSNVYEFKGKFPMISDSAYIHRLAEVTGDVVIGDNSYIGAGVRIIGNSHGPIKIGDNVIILENSVLHLLPDNELIINNNVVIGPNSTIHGTIIGQNTIIESGSIICDYSVLGENNWVKAGSLVQQRAHFYKNDIMSGFPAKKIGENKNINHKPDWAIR